MTEWVVWLKDGTTRTSREHTWDDVRRGPGVLVVIEREPGGAATINWGDGRYGMPGTNAEAGIASDEVFERVLAEARAQIAAWSAEAGR